MVNGKDIHLKPVSNLHRLETLFPDIATIFYLYKTRQDGKLKEWKQELEVLYSKIFHLKPKLERAKAAKNTFSAKILKEEIEGIQKECRVLDNKIHFRVNQLIKSQSSI